MHCGQKNHQCMEGGHEHNHHEMMVKDFKKRFWFSLVLTIPVLILSPTTQKFFGLKGMSFTFTPYILFILSSIVFFYGGFPFLKGLRDELASKNPGMMTLIGVAIGTAYIYSGATVFGLKGKMFFWELVSLIDVMLLGHWIEMRSVMGASKALGALAKLLPSQAHKVLENGEIQNVPLDQLEIGDKVVIKPGEKISADGVIVEGQSLVNESLLTGESKPVLKKQGDKVIGGSLNGEGSLVVRVEKMGKDSFISQVMEIVRKTQESKSKTQDLANRAALWLTIIALSVASLTFGIWFLKNKELAFALERAVTVMVIACPHALGLAIPLVVAVSTSLGAQRGFLIRERNAFEQARSVDAVIFDKTGTLTQGKFGVTDVLVLDEQMRKDDLLRYAASVESHSEHPIARAIVGISNNLFPVKNFKALPGTGASAEIEGKMVSVVGPNYLKQQNIVVDQSKRQLLSSQGKTLVFVLFDQEVKGIIGLSDVLRPESKQAIEGLKAMGIKSIMLTGDNKVVAEAVAKELGLDDFFAEVLPQQKAEKVKEIQSRGLKVAMVGDGINDAPALVQADVGIAIGAGTDVAIESADIVLIKNDPRDVLSLITLARVTYSKMKANLFWATGYNIIAIPLAAGLLYNIGLVLSPAAAALLMSLSTVIVAVNARFLKI